MTFAQFSLVSEKEGSFLAAQTASFLGFNSSSGSYSELWHITIWTPSAGNIDLSWATALGSKKL